ncbi:GNAT family N-acetyltransferase [Deinococcus yavapaiensis]|uniref:Putative acetyltransferase n=1 Tax=Deinococcus yavapaiensis KR-236 TaxID=694435 RepID=A0A318SGF6_9DEIO|nr:GNAT family N-acetyltransferase [Deinococcus yavapaiensis]PYE48990.1 putative acetyltransferase [Deinococcus yavapaiensis KR-236]
MTHLALPDVRLRASFIDFVRECHEHGSGLGDTRELKIEDLEADFAAHVRDRRAFERRENLGPGFVPQTEKWLVDEERVLGRVKIRHELNDRLREFGGHIGYEIRPSERRRGLGSLALRLALDEARALGLSEVLLTCDEDNLGSRGVIEHNGGVLEGVVKLEWYAKPICRYWIRL